jgi:ankyrin repeat protein
MSKWASKRNSSTDGNTALHFASFSGNAKIIELLVRAGADIQANNKHGLGMMHVAA